MPIVSTSVAKEAPAAAALLKSLIANPGRTQPTLLKDPAITTDPSWHLCLPPHFNTALGLKFLQKQKVKNKEIVERWREWVQGSNFAFSEGSIIYDRDVSQMETWGEKLEAVDFYVVLGSTRPVSLKTNRDASTGLKKVERDPGLVTFRIYSSDSSTSPSPGKVADVMNANSFPQDQFLQVTQDEFVRFAITGFS